ncbi:MAG: sulfotransferase family 2 domain-containing protein [Nocardioides sp.]
MPVFIKDQRYVLFPHVPKTGGTSIERLFRRNGWQMYLRDSRVGKGSLHYVRRCSPQHLHAAVLRELIDLSRVDLCFMVVRDPIARFRSEYAMRQKDPTKTDPASVDTWADRILTRYEHNPYAVDNHFRPQHEFLLPDTEVFRLEDGLDAMMASLNERHDLGVPNTVEHRLKSADRHGMSSGDVQLSPDLEARLRELYAEDFRQFGY